jgi:hypothetical protein
MVDAHEMLCWHSKFEFETEVTHILLSLLLAAVKHTRVRLIQRNEDIYDSYINANYINTSVSRNDQLFIATQGPLETTIENFWRMVD